MSKEIPEVKTPIEKFIESPEYDTLKQEIAAGVAEAFRHEEGEQDSAPLLSFFEKKTEDQDFTDFEKEKIFWQAVESGLPKDIFPKLYDSIAPLIEEKNYKEADTVIHKGMQGIIQRLSPTIYKKFDIRGSGEIILQEAFYHHFPEVEALTRGHFEGKKEIPEAPRGRTQAEMEEVPPPRGEEFREGFREELKEQEEQYLVDTLPWEIPWMQDLVPGFIIEFEDRSNGEHFTLEIINLPYKTIYIDAEVNGVIKQWDLWKLGLISDLYTRKWNTQYRPITWGRSKESKE